MQHAVLALSLRMPFSESFKSKNLFLFKNLYNVKFEGYIKNYHASTKTHPGLSPQIANTLFLNRTAI